jgi:phage-related minor tail protein
LTDHLTEQFVLANCIETIDKIESHLDRIATASEEGFKDLNASFSSSLINMELEQEKFNKLREHYMDQGIDRMCGVIGGQLRDLIDVVETKLNAKAR